MKTKLLTITVLTAGLALAACTNNQDRRSATVDAAPAPVAPAAINNTATTAKTTTIDTTATIPAAGRGSLGSAAATDTTAAQTTTSSTTTMGTAAGSDVDRDSLKPHTEHSDIAGNTNDASAFNRPQGNGLRSAINGDANNPKNTVVAQGEPNTVSGVILQQMLAKDDEYNSRIATIKEHQDALAPSQQKFVRQNLKDATSEKQNFDKLLGELKENSQDNQIKNQLNVASAKVDRCLRKIEAHVK